MTVALKEVEKQRQRMVAAELCIAEISLAVNEPGSATNIPQFIVTLKKALDDHLARRALQQELNKEK